MKISYGIEKIIWGLFSGCTNITGKLNLPTSITYLGYVTFSNSSLDCVITLSYNCIIEQNAFYDCGNLKINFIN